MLNPSTADETLDDPTIRRCVGFAKRDGYGSITVVNLFGLRSPYPETLLSDPDPVGPANDTTIKVACEGRTVVAAWGASDRYTRGRERDVLQLLSDHPRLLCLGTTKDGSPRHPLYVKGDQPLVTFPATTAAAGDADGGETPDV